MENMQAKRLGSSTRHNRLVDRGRQNGMTPGEINRSLRDGRQRNQHNAPLFVAADLDRIARRFMCELSSHGFSVTFEDLRLSRRAHARPRMCLATLLRELTNASFPAIARFLGRDDHTTIIHACEVGAARAMERDPDLSAAVVATFNAFRPPVP